MNRGGKVSPTKWLPEIGTLETPSCDFKKFELTLKPDRFELAKDVAAMANAEGGTIWLGAHAHNGRLARYQADVTRADALALARAYEEAVRDRCSPVPALACEVIEEDGVCVLAVDVRPSTSPIACRAKGDKADGWGDRCWVFFTRVGSHTRDIQPEVLGMMMVPEFRRLAILLRSAQLQPPIRVKLMSRGAASSFDKGLFTISDVQEDANTVALVGYGDVSTKPWSIAIDQVQTVFRQDGTWCLVYESLG